jgi:hypothetical protein
MNKRATDFSAVDVNTNTNGLAVVRTERSGRRSFASRLLATTLVGAFMVAYPLAQPAVASDIGTTAATEDGGTVTTATPHKVSYPTDKYDTVGQGGCSGEYTAKMNAL